MKHGNTYIFYTVKKEVGENMVHLKDRLVNDQTGTQFRTTKKREIYNCIYHGDSSSGRRWKRI
jgi:hypothetical protein